jgi:hypothetical protein
MLLKGGSALSSIFLIIFDFPELGSINQFGKEQE